MNGKNLRLVVFDMDNTIADETVWLFAAYRDIAESITSQTGEPSTRVYDMMVQRFRSKGRKDILQDCCIRFGLPTSLIDDWLQIMRSVRLEHGFPVFNWVIEFCHLIPSIKKAILTNGNPKQQKEKFRQLAPRSLQQELFLVCAAEFESKPSPMGLWHAIHSLGATSETTLFLGDSPEDRECAEAANVEFVEAGEFKYQPVSQTLNHLGQILGRNFHAKLRDQKNTSN
jgi:HAD superfamily hydrolase (TIGR01549 family)